MSTRPTWTKPYYGIQHTHWDASQRRCTVSDHGTWAELNHWTRHCGFSPHTTQHDTAQEAREAGERWLASDY